MAVPDDPADWPEFVHDGELVGLVDHHLFRGGKQDFAETDRWQAITGIEGSWIAGIAEGLIPAHRDRLRERLPALLNEA